MWREHLYRQTERKDLYEKTNDHSSSGNVLLCAFLPSAILAEGASEPPEELVSSAEPDPTPLLTPEPIPSIHPSTAPPLDSQSDTELARLYIDNKHRYEKMERSYSQGYVPTVEKGVVTVILPLLCDGQLQGDCLRAKVGLGETTGPFVTKNYEKTVERTDQKVNDGKDKVSGYYVYFQLDLKQERFMGSYPVTISVTAKDISGALVQEEFTIYVTIREGKDPNATPGPVVVPEPISEPVVLGPKILVQSCQAVSLEEGAEPGIVNAGDRLRVTVILLNTSKTEALENMMVMAGSPGENFALASPADSVYIGDMAAGGTIEVTYEYTVRPETPAGQYVIPLSYDFAYGKGLTGAGTGSARVNIRQPLEMEFALMQLPNEVVISDIVEVNVQAINLSHAKAYNVRAALEADGLLPSGTAFFGDLDGGTSAEKPLQVQITSLTQGDFPTGKPMGGLPICMRMRRATK